MVFLCVPHLPVLLRAQGILFSILSIRNTQYAPPLFRKVGKQCDFHSFKKVNHVTRITVEAMMQNLLQQLNLEMSTMHMRDFIEKYYESNLAKFDKKYK